MYALKSILALIITVNILPQSSFAQKDAVSEFINSWRDSSDIVKEKIVYPEIDDPQLELISTELLPAESGIKAVIISPDKSKIYGMNLEGMSIYEYDRESRKLLRKVEFDKTPGRGWDYSRGVSISSYEEKPVEGHLTHDGRYLWVSLHNAEGVVVWDVKGGETFHEGAAFKDVTVFDYTQADSLGNPLEYRDKFKFMKTGKTPKVITSTSDDKYLFVSNWHSYNVSVLDIRSDDPAVWYELKELPNSTIPRGMAVSEDDKLLYVTEMGGSNVAVFSLDSLVQINEFYTGRGPRHIVLKDSIAFISLNSLAKVLRVNLNTYEVINSTRTGRSPRTIELSDDGNVLFVVSYNGHMLQAFAASDLSKINDWDSKYKPVGVTVYQKDDIIEAWVCNYNSGDIRVFTYRISSKSAENEKTDQK